MLQFSRGNFFLKQNSVKSNDLKKIIKNNFINQRIKSNFEIDEISSLKNFRENSILFLEKDVKIVIFN